jgi:hypothetical protein
MPLSAFIAAATRAVSTGEFTIALRFVIFPPLVALYKGHICI